jgi:hypothetical protein
VTYDMLTEEQTAFLARLNVHARGLPGINERFDKDSFVTSVCSPLGAVFANPAPGEKPEELNRRIKTFSRAAPDEKAD